MRELWEISRTMREARPVFLVGEARSGTSLLYRTLQKHPSFRPHRQNLVETEIFAHLHRAFLFDRRPPEPLLRFMLDDRAAWDAFIRTIRPLRIVSAAWAPVNYVVRSRPHWLWNASLGAWLVRAYFFHAWRARGCSRLLEKTPTNTANLPKLTASFPHARLLYIHRHPVDVFTSYRRRAAVDPNAPWARLSLHEFCVRYETSTARALAWRRAHPADLHCVSYEAFTREPAEAFRSICSFLDEPFVPEALEERTPDHDRWRVDPHLWGGIVQQTKRWEDYLDAGEAQALQDRLAATMTALGYAPYE